MYNPIGRSRLSRENEKGQYGTLKSFQNAVIDSRRQDSKHLKKTKKNIKNDIENTMNNIFHKNTGDGPEQWNVDSRTGRQFKKNWVNNNSSAVGGLEPTVGDSASWGDERGLNAKQRFNLKRSQKKSHKEIIKNRYKGGASARNNDSFVNDGWAKTGNKNGWNGKYGKEARISLDSNLGSKSFGFNPKSKNHPNAKR